MNGEYCVSILLLCTAQSLKDKFCLQRQIKPSQLVLDSYSRSQETLKGNREKGAEKLIHGNMIGGVGAGGIHLSAALIILIHTSGRATCFIP